MTDKRKLVIYSDAHVYGGAERYLANLIPILSKNWEIFLVYPPRTDFSPLFTSIEKQGIAITKINQASLKFSYSNYRKIKHLFENIQPDLIVFNQGHFFTSKIARLAAIFGRFKHIIIQHGPPSDGQKTLNLANKIFANYSFSKSRAILVPSQNSAKFFKNFKKICPVKVIYHAIDHEVFKAEKYDKNALKIKYQIPQNHQVLCLIGRLEADKNPLWALEVFKKVLQKMPDTHLFVLGSGSLENQMHKSIEISKLLDKVTHIDVLPNSAEVLAISDVLVHPSASESFSYTVVEAMAMGVVPVTFSVDALPEIIADAGYCVKYGDLDQMAEKVIDVLNNDSKELAKNGINLTREKYSLEKNQSATLEFFNTL